MAEGKGSQLNVMKVSTYKSSFDFSSNGSNSTAWFHSINYCFICFIYQKDDEVNISGKQKELEEAKTEVGKKTLEEHSVATMAQNIQLTTARTDLEIMKLKAEIQKHIAEMTEKYEMDLVNHARKEILRYEKETLNYMGAEEEKHADKTYERLIELLIEIPIQQILDETLTEIIEEFKNTKKGTLRFIEEEALKQVTNTVKIIPEKSYNSTMKDLTHLIEKPLNEILKDKRKHSEDAFKTMTEQILTTRLENFQEITNFQQTFEKERKHWNEELPQFFNDAMNTYHDDLHRQEEEAVERLTREVERIPEKAMQPFQWGTVHIKTETPVIEKIKLELEKFSKQEMQKNVRKQRKK